MTRPDPMDEIKRFNELQDELDEKGLPYPPELVKHLEARHRLLSAIEEYRNSYHGRLESQLKDIEQLSDLATSYAANKIALAQVFATAWLAEETRGKA